MTLKDTLASSSFTWLRNRATGRRDLRDLNARRAPGAMARRAARNATCAIAAMLFGSCSRYSSASRAKECSLPESLDGLSLVSVVDANFTPRNPNAGRVVSVRFTGSTYTLSGMDGTLVATGEYRYTRLTEQVGHIRMSEIFQGRSARYTLTLVCETPFEGTFVFSQSRGPIQPERRQNVGRYYLAPQLN